MYEIRFEVYLKMHSSMRVCRYFILKYAIRWVFELNCIFL